MSIILQYLKWTMFTQNNKIEFKVKPQLTIQTYPKTVPYMHRYIISYAWINFFAKKTILYRDTKTVYFVLCLDYIVKSAISYLDVVKWKWCIKNTVPQKIKYFLKTNFSNENYINYWKMWKFFLWCILLTFYVTIVHGQFSKGVIKNNVFFVDDASETNSGAALDLISGLNIGYSRNKLKPTIVSATESRVLLWFDQSSSNNL